MMDSALGKPYDYAVACLNAAGGNLDGISVPLQTLLIVESAQGIIDSGGLEYFFEADFPNTPPYSWFVDAYRRIGADEAADCIEAASLLFPFDEPQCFAPLRELWLEKFSADPHGEFRRLSNRICGDGAVWEMLANYVNRHPSAFGGA